MRFLLLLYIAGVSLAGQFTTSLGDSYPYIISALTTDPAGNTYIVGSRQLATAGTVSLNSSTNLEAGTDVFVSKLDPSGNLLFTDTFAGKGVDTGTAIALDPSGNIYIGGTTTSPDFPLSEAQQSQSNSNGTGFIIKLSNDGTAILYATYLGGAIGASSVSGLATDAKGNLYVTGTTGASDFPQTSGLPTASLSVAAVFVAEIPAAGGKPLYSGALAPTGNRAFATAGIAVDAAGEAFLRYNDTVNTGFIAKINAGGAGFGFSPMTFPSTVNAIAVDAAGDTYLAAGNSIEKLDATGSVVWTFTMQGGGNSPPISIALGAGGNVWATGMTSSTTFPNANGWTTGKDFNAWETLTGIWVPHDTRDQIVDFVRRWSEKTDISAGRFIMWLDITASKFYDWQERYGKVNEHNGWVPRDFWLEDWEKQAIVEFHLKNPLEGYRRLTFMMLDADIVAVSPSSVWRVLSHAERAAVVICLSSTCDSGMIVSTSGGCMKILFRNPLSKVLVFTFILAMATHAETIRSVSTFATGAAVMATGPDSITVGGGSVWVSYTNGADSTGKSGHSVVVQYDMNGVVRHTYSIAGYVDGLKIEPETGLVWALQNQDGNSTLTLIDPKTGITPDSPLHYKVVSGTRGYDDVVFRNGQIFLSYTNPGSPTDATIQRLENRTSPLIVTPVLTQGATGVNLATDQSNQPTSQNDPDSLKLTPGGGLMLTSGDDGQLIFVVNPESQHPNVAFLSLVDSTHAAVSGLDDAFFATSEAGTFYLTDTGNNRVLKIEAENIASDSLYACVGSLNQFVKVNIETGVVTSVLNKSNNLMAPHGLAFVPRSNDENDGEDHGGDH